MPAAKFRSREVFDAFMWDGINHADIVEWLGSAAQWVEVRPSDPSSNTPKQLAILVGWGTMQLDVGDYVIRKGRDGGPYSVDNAKGEDFLVFNEELPL